MERYESTWRIFLVRGLCAILFGLIALMNPDATLQGVLLLFAVYVVVDAVVAYVGSRSAMRRPEMRQSLILDALAGMAIGALTLFLTAVAAFVILFLFGIWAIVTGGLALAASLSLMKNGIGDWLLVLKSAALMLFGILLAFFPIAGVTAIIWLVGVFAVTYGVIQIALAVRFHGRQTKHGAWHAG